MTDLVVIHPGAAHGIYGSDLADSLVAVEPPLWCRLIAGYVRDLGFSVKIIDAEAEQLSPNEVAHLVNADKPRLVCIAVYGHQPSASTQQMTGAGATASQIKMVVGAGQKIIMVGGHVSALPEQTLREEEIDYACIGEGPLTISGLLRMRNFDPLYLGTVPGLVWWRERFSITINAAGALLPLESLHGDAWDLLPMGRYRAHNWQCFDDLSRRQPYASIYTSLGCPYQCSFCCINAPFQANKYRMRKPAEVVDEVVMLYREHGVRTIKITDEMFVLSERHYTAICEGLVASGIADALNIWSYARVDTVKPHTLALLRRAGIRWLALGIESGSAHVRDGAEKAMDENDILETVRAVQAAGINVIANYIFGLPDDDMRTMAETLKLAIILNTEFANFYSAMAYPGSKLYTEALAKGWRLPASWRGYSQHNDDCTPLETKYVYGSDVLRFRDDAFQTYFMNPAYQDMVREKFGAEAADHVRAMTTFRLKRKLLQESKADAQAS